MATPPNTKEPLSIDLTEASSLGDMQSKELPTLHWFSSRDVMSLVHEQNPAFAQNRRGIDEPGGFFILRDEIRRSQNKQMTPDTYFVASYDKS